MNFFTVRIRIEIRFVKKNDIHFNQRVRDSNTHFMSIRFKSKFPMGENYLVPCHDFKIQACFFLTISIKESNAKYDCSTLSLWQNF